MNLEDYQPDRRDRYTQLPVPEPIRELDFRPDLLTSTRLAIHEVKRRHGLRIKTAAMISALAILPATGGYIGFRWGENTNQALEASGALYQADPTTPYVDAIACFIGGGVVSLAGVGTIQGIKKLNRRLKRRSSH